MTTKITVTHDMLNAVERSPALLDHCRPTMKTYFDSVEGVSETRHCWLCRQPWSRERMPDVMLEFSDGKASSMVCDECVARHGNRADLRVAIGVEHGGDVDVDTDRFLISAGLLGSDGCYMHAYVQDASYLKKAIEDMYAAAEKDGYVERLLMFMQTGPLDKSANSLVAEHIRAVLPDQAHRLPTALYLIWGTSNQSPLVDKLIDLH